MLTCSACQSENPEGNRFCMQCGQPLTEAAEAAPPVIISPPPAEFYPVTPTLTTTAKDRTVALLLEIAPGLFGVLGLGWLYAGQTRTGLFWLVGVLIWQVIGFVAVALTAGLACFCTLPINWALVAVSAFLLNAHIQQHPEAFRK